MKHNEDAKEVDKREQVRKAIRESGFARFLRNFFYTLVHSKKYMLSFILTIFFFCSFFMRVTNNSEGFFQRLENDSNKKDNTVEPTVDDDINSNKQVTDILDISDYVGVYSREVTLSEKVELNDSCSISRYKVVYKINKDKTIYKYFYNDCVGVIKIWNDTLKYNTINNVRYISTDNTNYLFSNSGIKEIDGETYRVDSDLDGIREKNNINGLKILFYDTSAVFMEQKNLVIIKGNSVVLNYKEQYKNNGGKLDSYVYQSKTDGKFNFIVFSNEEALNCYEAYEESNEKDLYKIYSISYNKDNKSFNNPVIEVERKINEGCQNFDEDMKILSK